MWSFSFSKNFSGFSYHQMRSRRALIHSQCFPSNDPRFLLPSPNFCPWHVIREPLPPLRAHALAVSLRQFSPLTISRLTPSTLFISSMSLPHLPWLILLNSQLPPTHSLLLYFIILQFTCYYLSDYVFPLLFPWLAISTI